MADSGRFRVNSARLVIDSGLIRGRFGLDSLSIQCRLGVDSAVPGRPPAIFPEAGDLGAGSPPAKTIRTGFVLKEKFRL